MDLFWTNILCAALAVGLSLAFGFLPLAMAGRWAITIDPNDPDYKRSRRGNQILAFLLNLSGGVLLANCFCHWLPEVREGEDEISLISKVSRGFIVKKCESSCAMKLLSSLAFQASTTATSTRCCLWPR